MIITPLPTSSRRLGISIAYMLKFKTMEEIGIVERIEGMNATVRIPKKSACEGCCSSGTCTPVQQSMEVVALNPIHAQIGQKVRIIMKPYIYLKGSVIIYGIPALALVVGAIIGKEVFSSYMRNNDPDTVSAISGFAAFAISFFS